MDNTDITSHGYSATSFAIAQALQRSATYRRAVKMLLDSMEHPVSYSNQDFDQQQHLATLLADAVRAMKPSE